jgi:hypothetical protein
VCVYYCRTFVSKYIFLNEIYYDRGVFSRKTPLAFRGFDPYNRDQHVMPWNG